MSAKPKLVTPRFVLVVASGIAYFMSLGVLTPVVPPFVKHVLGGNDLAVGITVGVMFVSAVVVRPLAGRIGDRRGRRILMVGGAGTVAVSLFCYLAASSVPIFVAARLLTGLGEAAFFVGAATMITDLAPIERRGEAISYWSVAVYTGLAFGPLVGELWKEQFGYSALWVLAGCLATVATGLALCTRDVARPGHEFVKTPLIHRGALLPGTAMFFGLIAVPAFSAFTPLYARQVGLRNVALVFFMFGILVLLIRIFGARLPDAIGAVRAANIALIGTVIGMGTIALWASVGGLFAGVAVFALGTAFLYPAMLMLGLETATPAERGAVVGTISTCFDLAQGIGSLITGGVALFAGYRGAYGIAAIAAVVAVVILWRVVVPARNRLAVSRDLG